MKQIWQSDDGTVVGSKDTVQKYELTPASKLESDIEKVKNSYSVITLLNTAKLSEAGVWHVKGEDSNPDFSGPHYQPTLGYVKGTLAQAIEFAAKSNSYFTWGAGGSIKKLNIVEL